MADEDVKKDDVKKDDADKGNGSGNSEYAKKLAASSERIGELEAEIEGLKKSVKKNDDKDKVKQGEAVKLLEERTAELEAAQGRLKGFEGALSKRADGLLAKLPEKVQTKVKKFKDKLDVGDWLEMIEDEFDGLDTKGNEDDGEENVSDDKRDDIPNPTPRTRKPVRGGKRELTDKTYEMLEKFMVAPDLAENDIVVQKEDDGDGHRVAKFYVPIRKMFEKMKTGEGRIWSHAEAAKRKQEQR